MGNLVSDAPGERGQDGHQFLDFHGDYGRGVQWSNSSPSDGMARPLRGMDSSEGGLIGGASRTSLAAYLRRVLEDEKSLQAAFHPVLLASKCEQPGFVDRSAFALAIQRICQHFDPTDLGRFRPSVATVGQPFTEDEAFAQFCDVLQALSTCVQVPSYSVETVPDHYADSNVANLLPVDWSQAELQQSEVGLPGTSHSLMMDNHVLPLGAPRSSSHLMAGEEVKLGNRPPMPTRRGHSGSFPATQADVGRFNSMPSRGGRTGSMPATEAQLSNPSVAQIPMSGNSRELSALLEASRTRVAGFKRSLSREEELLNSQAAQIRALESLQRELEAQEERRRAAAAKANELQWPGSSTTTTLPTSSVCVEDDLDRPMSLEDVKRHLATAQTLKKRMLELEEELDRREAEAAALSDELRARQARAASAATAVAEQLSENRAEPNRLHAWMGAATLRKNAMDA